MSLEWQPIETAPKDKFRLIVGNATWADGGFYVGYRDYGAWIDPAGFAFDPQPTHWMLPDPPEARP